MYPPLFETVSVNAAVQASLGSSPCRVYPIEAEEKTVKPYAVYNFSGDPELYVNQNPDITLFAISIDVIGDNPTQVMSAAEDLRNAIEGVAHVISISLAGRDPDTKDYVYTMTVDWWDAGPASV